MQLLPQNLNASQLSLCFATQRYQEQIQADGQAAVDVGIRGTPGFLLGFLQADGQVKGIVIQGALPFATFRSYITGFLEAAH
ncbi:MAG: hypothetical protein R2880_12265 [Deinococcales bacterium]